MSLSAETHRLMAQMHDFVRSGRDIEIPGVRPDRMLQYRRLVRNVFEDTLNRAYPISVTVLSPEEWGQLIDAFMLKAEPQTPYIWKMPFEFYEFVVNEDFAAQFNRPYLDDLLFFEWIEIDLFTMPDKPVMSFKSEGDFLKETIVLNPDHQILELEFPVHKMPASETLKHRGQYFVLAFRQRESGVVKFVEVDPVLALVWQELAATPQSGEQVVRRILKLLGRGSEEQLTTMVLPFFNDMLLQGAILGFAV